MRQRCRERRTKKNKPGYTATKVACGWAGAVIGQPCIWAAEVEQEPLICAKKANDGGPTDQPEQRVGLESRDKNKVAEVKKE